MSPNRVEHRRVFYFSKFSEKFKYSEMEKLFADDMSSEMGCCGVDAIVTVDSKGQLVLPKDLREKIKLEPNDKLAIISCGGNEACCLIMVKAENLGSSIKSFLKPVLKGVLG